MKEINKKNLYTVTPKRLFTFGCSFTKYALATWANILGFELNKTVGCEFYNFGKCASGNAYISNIISQADQYYNFNFDDLVIVCWTSITREDRWITNKWDCPGNIYSPNTTYDKIIVKKIADNIHFLMRDLSNIKLVDSLLKHKTQYHFLSIKNLCDSKLHVDVNSFNKLKKNYQSIIDKIYPSYYEVLWENDLRIKNINDKQIIHKNYKEGHPLPLEHLYYLHNIFDYNFSNDTKLIVKKINNEYKNLILDLYSNQHEECHPADLPKEKQKKFYIECEKFFIYKSKTLSDLIIV